MQERQEARVSYCKELGVQEFTLLPSQQINLPEFQGCWEMTGDSWTRSKEFYYSQNSKQHEPHGCSDSPYPPCPVGVTMNGPSGHFTCCGTVSQLRTPELREPQSFKMGWNQSWMTFAPDGYIMVNILSCKQTCALPLRETLSLSSKAADWLYIPSWNASLEQSC